jgi:hypothetical protein
LGRGDAGRTGLDYEAWKKDPTTEAGRGMGASDQKMKDIATARKAQDPYGGGTPTR